MSQTGASRRLPWAALALVLVAMVAAGIYRLARPLPPPLPVLAQLPAFVLLDQAGRSVAADDLRGRVWIADFIFTRCGGICPVLSSAMAGLAGEFAGDDRVRLVTFTVDPMHDTSDVLKRYAERFATDPEQWRFLTGPRPAIHTLVGDGFRLSVVEGDPAQVAESELVTHSDRLVIVDPDLRVRAYHHGTAPDAVETVAADVRRLLD